MKRKYIVLILTLILSISIGYAYLYQELKLNGLVSITSQDDSFLINRIIKQAIEDTTINFGAISSDTNGKGVYKLTKIATSTPIYYYRGEVYNNNVLFGGFCWKILRTTKTGGVKLVYNGIPNEEICNNTGDATEIGKSAYNPSSNDVKYIGYMYDNNTINSTIKGVVDTWYEENLLIYQEYLEDTPFYNERDYVTGVGISRAYAARQRIWGTRTDNYGQTVPKTTIKLGAANAEDIFTVSSELGNGALIYPIGLLTTDEVVMAGGTGAGSSLTVTNTTYYLYSGCDYWTLSPTVVEYPPTTAKVGVRPVISLKPETKIVSGDGTKEKPFVIT